MGAKEDFIELMVGNAKANGLDELSCRLIANLYVEPKELSLEELSERTGYSLSSVCTALKFAEQIRLVRRMSKPGSRKAFFSMEKDMAAMFADVFVRKYENIILPSKQKLPEIIQKYKSERSKDAKAGAKIAENYYRQILGFERMFVRMNEEIKALARKA
jgi:HTH-type transcriptional regulator, osmoprotectant uptake regulator